MPFPTVDEKQVLCNKCGHVFASYLWRAVETESGKADTLVDRDNDVIYDLVKVCHYCGEVFHYHTKEKTMVRHSAIYQDAFETLMKHYRQPPLETALESVIIDSDNPSTGKLDHHPAAQTE